MTEMNNYGRPGGLSSCGSSPAVSPVPASIPDAGIAGKVVCSTCTYVRTFKARMDEQARYGFGEIGWECRKLGYEGYTTAFGGCSFHTFAQGMSASGQDASRLEAQPASPVACDAPITPIEGNPHEQ